MSDVRLTLLGGFDGHRRRDRGARHGLAAEEGARAREAARARAGTTGSTASRRWTCSGATAIPAAAANNLHQAVHVARRALDSGAIESRDEVLAWRRTVDVDEFELAAADARRVETAAAYRAALALYGGELLPENRYDDWAEHGATSSRRSRRSSRRSRPRSARRHVRAAGGRELVRRSRAASSPS